MAGASKPRWTIGATSGASRHADLGAHLSVAGGLETCFERASALGAGSAQIFVKNQRQWAARPLGPVEAKAFAQAWGGSAVGSVVAHATYLVNLGAEDDAIWQKSVECLACELGRGAALGLMGVVLHPGSNKGDQRRTVERISSGIVKAFALADAQTASAGFKPVREARLLLENTAGQGSSYGVKFEELRALIDALPPKVEKRVDVCLDTCHMHAAGYDVTTGKALEATIGEALAVLGKRIAAVHVNDSQKPRGSRVDRHANLGAGVIGLECFEALVNDPRLAGVAKILETPEEDEGHERDLAILKRFKSDRK